MTSYSAGMCRSHAQELTRKLTQDAINQELTKLGLPHATIIEAPSVVAADSRSASLGSSGGVLVAVICAAVFTMLLSVCVCVYYWKKKKHATDQTQQVEMQQGAENVAEGVVEAAPDEEPAQSGQGGHREGYDV